MKKVIMLLFATLLMFACVEEEPNYVELDMGTQMGYVTFAMHPDDVDFESFTGKMPDYYGHIVSVADGDTFYVDWYTEDKMGIRVKGVDTPETKDRRKDVQFWGPEASAYAAEVLQVGTPVMLRFEGNITGPFGRLLAYVWYWNGQEWIYWNQEVLESGNAFVYIDYEFEYPNEFLEFQQVAIDNGLGMWSDPELIENDVAMSAAEFAEKKSWYRRNYYSGD